MRGTAEVLCSATSSPVRHQPVLRQPYFKQTCAICLIIHRLLLEDEAQLPANEATAAIVDAMAAAHRARGDSDAIMAMVVQPGERNAYDQQARHRSNVSVATPAIPLPSGEACAGVLGALPSTAAGWRADQLEPSIIRGWSGLADDPAAR